jgi:outer membrane protein assembly factor BamB
MASDLADLVIVAEGAEGQVPESEVTRVLCPLGRGFVGGRTLTKAIPSDVDDWSHPYHGPDNNPQSEDRLARAPYLTQFLAEPYYAPLTQVGVASAGRMFKAFGNIAFHEREEALLNSLVAFNGYNGTMLWRRKLTPGVMIHRNTMVATPDVLYVGDDKSCKRIDTTTGRLIDEIVPPADLAGGTFWKWIALENETLYALIGAQEQRDPVVRQRRQAHGWPWDPLSLGFNQADNPWGFGANLLALNPVTGEVLWKHHEEEEIDSRALCMKGERIYVYRHGSYLACLDARNGDTIWRKTPETGRELFEALGPSLDRQDWRTNWRTAAYLKCSDEALYFAGPTVGKLLAVSAEDGSVLWEHPYDNFQLVLREDGLYGISGEVDEHKSLRFDPLTGEVLAELETHRRGCTRPNGAVDAIFYRAKGGSTRLDVESQDPQWISPMRAQCHDGVTIANGLLYWWPSTCDCQNTLYGLTCLGPARDFEFGRLASDDDRLETGEGDPETVSAIPASPLDWPTFRANNTGTVTTDVSVQKAKSRLWWFNPETSFTPTAPVAAGGIVFLGGSDGIVRALDGESGNLIWKAYTGGGIRFSPTIWESRVFVGSADGWVYSYEAASGRLLWRFRAAPIERKMPVYGVLSSTWPVASGVLVEDGVAYAAAGIANYDGIHVYALDARTGNIKWQNNNSGHLDPESKTGVSVQGHMLIHDGKLYLAGGTSISPAVYDLATGKCLNDLTPLELVGSTAIRGQELFKIGDKVVAGGKPLYGHPDYPVWDPTVFDKMLHTTAHGRDIIWLNSKKILSYSPIPTDLLNRAVHAQPTEPAYMIPGWGTLDELREKPLWEYECDAVTAVVRCRNAVLVAGIRDYGSPSVEAIDIETGQPFWDRAIPLQGHTVPWGIAVDRGGRIIVTLKEGRVMCFGPQAGA